MLKRFKDKKVDRDWLNTNFPCMMACPAHTNAGRYVSLIAEGRFEEAYKFARDPNPLASICGRVCEMCIRDRFRRIADLLTHRRNRNTQSGSRRNIAYHYDLGNEFYRLFLDRNLAYSCAYYDSVDDTLEQAQIHKFDRICRKLQLSPRDHVLEIGTGWGGFAAHAAETYGCRVTTTTISRQQHDYAREVFSQSRARERIELLFEDYRNLRGQFDKIVSIEMFEAVGYEHYDDYFGACDGLLKADGSMLLLSLIHI